MLGRRELLAGCAALLMADVASAQTLTGFGPPGPSTPVGLATFKAALARVKAGTGRGKIAVIGDSTSMGAGAGTSGTTNLNGAAIRSWPQGMQRFNSSPNYLASNSWWGTQGYDGAAGITLTGYDTRLAQGANWAPNLSTLGGKVIRYAPGAVNNFSFTPTSAFDTIVAYFLKNNGNGTCTINVDGGSSLGTINTNSGGALVWATQTFTVAKGLHTINLVPNNDAQMFFGGLLCYDSTVPAIDVMQTAVYGATAATFTPAVNVYDPINALKFIAPDLTIIDLTINDSNNGTALATYQSNLQTIITAAKVSGDVLLMVGPPSNTTQATNGTLDTYIAVLQGLCASNTCSLLNMRALWGSFAKVQSTYPYLDTLHPQSGGYQGPPANGFVDIGTAVANILARA
jgi:hypothetical protein